MRYDRPTRAFLCVFVSLCLSSAAAHSQSVSIDPVMHAMVWTSRTSFNTSSWIRSDIVLLRLSAL